MKLQGSVTSGIYTLKKDNEDARLGYCDMSVNGYLEADLEVPIGYLEAFASPGRIMFSVYRDSPKGTITGDITYTQVIQDTNSSVDLENGIFRSPLDGTFQFSISAESYGSFRSTIGVYVNGKREFTIVNDNDYYGNLSYMWILNLNSNDEVHLKVDTGSIYVNNDYDRIGEGRRVIFNGYLIKT